MVSLIRNAVAVGHRWTHAIARADESLGYTVLLSVGRESKTP